jgi:hypothetical protein
MYKSSPPTPNTSGKQELPTITGSPWDRLLAATKILEIIRKKIYTMVVPSDPALTETT